MPCGDEQKGREETEEAVFGGYCSFLTVPTLNVKPQVSQLSV